jgi:hypothetical protein
MSSTTMQNAKMSSNLFELTFCNKTKCHLTFFFITRTRVKKAGMFVPDFIMEASAIKQSKITIQAKTSFSLEHKLRL